MGLGSKEVFRQLARIYLRYFPIKIRGFWLYLNFKDTGLVAPLINGSYESYTREVLKEIVSEGFVVCDVGAHVGYHTMLFSKLVGNSGKIYSFEAAPENFRLLKRNIRVNKLKNIDPIQMAISDKKGMARLFFSEADTTDHRLVKPHDEKRQYVTVRQDSLDNILKKEKIDLIKIDIQGLEEKCLQGMKNLIKANNNISIIIEFWPEGLEQAGTKPESLFMKLIDYKLKTYLLDEEKRQTKRIKNFNTLLELIGETEFVNLLCKGKK